MGLYQGDKPLSSGKSPIAYAKDAGYTGTDDNFYTAFANIPDHISDSDNPHGTTASQVGAYTKEETNTLLQKKADLGENGKVPESQLPAMNYVPASEKGAVSGVATLGTDGKVPTAQLPNMDYAPSTHASQHASDGSDPITPASIGAATSDHTHSNYATSSHNHAASNITSGTLGVARGGTGKNSVTSGNFLVGNGTSALTEKTPAEVLSAIGAASSSHTHSGYATSSHNQAASTITAGTFAATGVKAATGTDYTTARVRNIQASTSGSSSLTNGNIYLVYE